MQTELEARILSELEEAGEENIPTLANTVFEPTGSTDESAELRDALTRLVIDEYVRVAVVRDELKRLTEMSKEVSLQIVSDLDVHLVFKSGNFHWTGGPRPWPEIVTTALGKRLGREILEARGYQWWRNKS